MHQKCIVFEEAATNLFEFKKVGVILNMNMESGLHIEHGKVHG